MAGTAKKSGKNRKYGRQKKQASSMRYKAENRCAKNKAKRLLKHAKKCIAKAHKGMKVPRGTQRRKNRIASGRTK
jgi:hypothetical protein